MKKGFSVLTIIVIGILVGINMAIYTVDQTELAIVVQLGKPVGVVHDPGLHFKAPFLHQVIFFDNRLLEYDAAPAEILTKDKKNLVVDNYSRWRIIDPLKLYQTVKNENGAQSRLDDIIYSQLRVELGSYSLTDIVSGARDEIMKKVTKKSSEIANDYGIEITDVRIKRADLPPENEKHVFGRMRAERERQAKKYRSEGEEEALKIKANADRQKVVLLAEAYRKAAKIKGDGDAQSTKIYAESYGQDPEFYSYIRSLEAYKKCLTKKVTLVLPPDSEFFKYLNKKMK